MMFIKKIKEHMFFTRGNIAFGLLTLMGFAVFLLVGFQQPTQNIFLGAQVGKGELTVPFSPVITSAEPGDGEVVLEWLTESNGGSEITSYIINVFTRDENIDVISTKNAEVIYTVTGLENDIEYGFSVIAVNDIGESEASRVVSAIPVGSKEQTGTPDAPSNLQVVSNDLSGVVITWFAPKNNGGSEITAYSINLTLNGKESSITTESKEAAYRLDKLSDGSYTIKVAAINRNGTGKYSDTVSVTVGKEEEETIPETPIGITLTPGDGTISVSWLPVEGTTISQYVILMEDASGNTETVSVKGDTTEYAFSDLKNGMSYTIRVAAENTAGVGEYSVAVKTSPDKNIAPSIIGTPLVVPSDRSAVISWTTNKNTSTKVDFGVLSVKTSTPEYNKETRVMNHSVTIVDLLPCTTYSFAVKSYDSLSQVANGGEQKFTTTGCITKAPIQQVEEDVVDTSVGGIIDFTETEVKTKLEIPPNLKLGESDVVFQVKLLEKHTTKEEIGIPKEKLSWVGEHVYDLSAYSSTTEEEVNDFDEPVTISMKYTRDDVLDISLSTLKIYHYGESEIWEPLDECTNLYDPNTAQGEISCKTSSFSIFGLFGEIPRSISTGTKLPLDENNIVIADSSTSTKSGGSPSRETTKESLVVMSPELKDSLANEKERQEDSREENKTVRIFNQDLWYGTAHLDVINLQKFLNEQGFILAESGPGSPGKETGYFGDRTFKALKSFQAFYQDSIAAPSSFQKASGYLDYFTRQFIQENF